MKIVIDMPDYVYCDIQAYDTIFRDKIEEVAKAIKNGTPLPKGHGRLFDEKDIVNGSYQIIGNRIYELEPIIEANTESEDKE